MIFRLIAAPVLALAALTPLAAQTAHTAAAATAHRQVVGYYPQWGVYNRRYVPKDLVTRGALSTLTQIDYAQANVSADGRTCVVGDQQADIALPFKAEDSIDGQADAPNAPLRGNFHQLQLLRARYPRLRILISLMGKRQIFELAARPENRVAFVSSCVGMYLQGHVAPGVELGRLFDGVDLDWEYPDNDHAEDFIALLQEFRRQMDALRPKMDALKPASVNGPRYTLSIAAGASAKNIAAVDWRRASVPLDQIGVMTYDYGGPWSHTTGFVAPLRSPSLTEETVAMSIDGFLQAGAPAGKLLLGVPFYAYQWTNVAETGTHGLNAPGDPVRGNLNQSTANTLLAAPNAKLYRDPISQSPWVYDGSNFLTFDDPTNLAAKMAFVDEKKLGGTMIWELSGDTTEGVLLKALRR